MCNEDIAISECDGVGKTVADGVATVIGDVEDAMTGDDFQAK